MPNPQDVNDLHKYDDVDVADVSHHHTIGFGPGQAAPGTLAYKLKVQDEGTDLGSNPSVVNFVGAGVSATLVDGVLTVTIAGGGGGGGAVELLDEGSSLVAAINSLNFVGPVVQATNVGPAGTITIRDNSVAMAIVLGG
jgi:hypothetical protein